MPLLLAGCGGGVAIVDAGPPTDAAVDVAAALDATVPPTCPSDLPAACPTPAPTYAAVSATIAARCASCHGPGGVAASRPLASYAQVFARRQPVLTQVYGCLMPPADAGVLLPGERAAVLAWLVCGAPP